jgi:hypothetical protein
VEWLGREVSWSCWPVIWFPFFAKKWPAVGSEPFEGVSPS